MRPWVNSDSTPEQADACVIGLGRVGLPLAALLAQAGATVCGVDRNPLVVAALAAGHSPFAEPGLEPIVRAAVARRRLIPAAVPCAAPVYLIAVPTRVTDELTLDDEPLQCALAAVAEQAPPGALIIVESTLPPGTMAGSVLPRVRSFGKGLRLAYCPERVLPGSALCEIRENERLIAGETPRETDEAAALYRRFASGQIHHCDFTTAELTKVAENIYRDVNIALANELARVAAQLGVDIWRVIDLANRHPRLNLHRPGPGVGGPCIPEAPRYLSVAAGSLPDLMTAARRVNQSMPQWAAARIREKLPGENPSVLLLGAAYKGGVDDCRNSPALSLSEALQAEGVTVTIHDPRAGYGQPEELADLAAMADGLVFAVPHPEWQLLDPRSLAGAMCTRQLFDLCRAVHSPADWTSHGFQYHGLSLSILDRLPIRMAISDRAERCEA